MTGSLTSRRRVELALEHRQPDRVPFDCPFGYLAYWRLAEHLGFEAEIEVKPGGPALNVRPPAAFLQQLQVDLYYVGLNPFPGAQPFEYGMPAYTDEWGVTYRRVENPSGIQYEMTGHPLAGATLEDLDDYPWPDPTDPALVDGLEAWVRDLYENTGFALVGRFNNSLFEQAFMLRGMERLFIDLVEHPDFASALLDRLTGIAVRLLEAGMASCGRYLSILRLAGDDIGHQRGTLLSPRLFRSLIKPRFARLYSAAKSLLKEHCPRGKLMAHTDGDVYPLIPDYIEMGLDVLNPVQPYVLEMEHERLKREFGDRLSFHGGMDIQRVLPFGTPEEVRAEAVKVMRALGPEGGFILAPTHYLLPDVAPKNVLAMRDAVLECGWY